MHALITSTMKENQEISLQFQDSKNFGSLSMVHDGVKIGDFFDSTKKENQELVSHDKQGEFQHQESIRNFGSLSMVDDGEKIGDFFDSTKKENQELSHDKQGKLEHQESIKNFGSLSMVDDGEKIGGFFDSVKKENQELSHDKPGDQFQHQESIKNFGSLPMVDDKKGDFFALSEKLGLSGREKLKRHWREVGGRVFVPERWGHEGSLREWMDCSSFDKILDPKGLKSAREALMSQGKRARSSSTTTSRMLEIRSR